MLTLAVEKRKKAEKLVALRKTGKIPAVFYGHKEISTPVAARLADFTKVWKQAGESSVIELKGQGIDVEALIYEVDEDPVTGVPRHADFYVIEKGKKIELSVQLVFTGVAPAVKDLGGILVKVLHEIKIEAMPRDLPKSIEVDVSSLSTFESQLLAKDVKLPSGVELKEKADEVVASIAEPKEEKEEVIVAPDLADIELSEKKGKVEEDGAEAEAPAAEKPKAETKEAK